MAGPYTVDASVYLNAFNPKEADHAESQRFLAYLQSQAIPAIGPTLLLPEVAATISRGRGNAELATQFSGALRRLPHLVLVSLDDPLADQAAEVAAHYRLRGSDSVYVAVALRFGSVLVTLDREQRERAGRLLTALTPTQALEALGEA
jgi:predicted nucleic acid-binding protein